MVFFFAVVREILLMTKNKETFPLLREIGVFKVIKPILSERKLIQRIRAVPDNQIIKNTNTPENISILQAIKLS